MVAGLGCIVIVYGVCWQGLCKIVKKRHFLTFLPGQPGVPGSSVNGGRGGGKVLVGE